MSKENRETILSEVKKIICNEDYLQRPQRAVRRAGRQL